MNRQERNEKMAAISWFAFVAAGLLVLLVCAAKYVKEKWLFFIF